MFFVGWLIRKGMGYAFVFLELCLCFGKIRKTFVDFNDLNALDF